MVFVLPLQEARAPQRCSKVVSSRKKDRIWSRFGHVWQVLDENVKMGSVWRNGQCVAKRGCWSPRYVVLAYAECWRVDYIRPEGLVCKGFTVLQMAELDRRQEPSSQKGLNTITRLFLIDLVRNLERVFPS